ncbi:MAG: AMIN domain-containing protein [Pseudomonadota bacterium]
MTKSKKHRILLAAVIVVAGLAAFILNGGLGRTSDQSAGAGQVRMAVDPTVIPSDMPSDMPVGMPPEASSEARPEAPPEAQPKAPAQASAPDSTASKPPVSEASAATPPAPKAPAAEVPAPETPASGGIISAASLESTAGGFVLTLVGDRPLGAVAHLTLASPPRLVLDLAGHWTLKAPNVLREESGPVRHVVIGAHPNKLRFVVHLREDSVLDRLGKPTTAHEGNTLRVTVPIARQP